MEEIKNDYIAIIKKIFKWVILSIIMAIPIGIVVGYYNIILTTANRYRKYHEYLIYFLPIAGVMITFYMTFVVFLCSLATTFFGGSAGKEGSAVAMGGTLGDFLAGKFNLSNEDQRTLVLCGVGSAFGVIYDVPFAGAILGMELVLKGKFHYQALIPAFLTTVFSNEIGAAIGNTKVNYPILMLDDLSFMILIKLVLLGIIFGVGGSIFNLVLDNSSKIYGIITKNPYLKAILGGVLTIVLFWLVGDNYNGLGQTFIRDAFDKPATLMDSVWKIIFTAIALGSVFQGGRGNPTFFVGAALGSAVAKYIGFPLESCTALGMIGVFCGATSLPITSIAMSLEYFGGDEMVAIMIVMTISYIISGFYDILTKNKLPKEKSKIFSGGVS